MSKYLEFLKSLGADFDENILNGELLEVKVNPSNQTWRMFFKFPKSMPWKSLNAFFMQIRKKLLAGEYLLTDLFFTVEYLDVDYNLDLVLDYYKAAIDVCSQRKAVVKSLDAYTIKFEDGIVKIIVPTKEDMTLVNEFLPMIEAFYKNYGLKNIKIVPTLDETEASLSTTHHDNIQKNYEVNEARSLENYMTRKAYNESNVETGSFYRNNKSKPILISVNEIPYTSMEIEEFKQIRGTDKVEVVGVLEKASFREIKSKKNGTFKLFEGVIFDNTDSIVFKRFYNDAHADFFEKELKKGKRVSIEGKIEWDNFLNDVVIMASKIDLFGIDASRVRFDSADQKRVELHAHTKMSVLDSILDVEEYVFQAAKYGHRAAAVTDHANCHVLPEFFKACKNHNIKAIAGIEANFVDDSCLRITHPFEKDFDLKDATYVIFDVETTGLSVNYDEIIEIGAVKLKNGMIIDTFSSFVKSKKKISSFITSITNITPEMVSDAPKIDEIFPSFLDFIKDSILVAQNADFDTGFLYATLEKLSLPKEKFPCIDTLDLARTLYPEGLKNYKLETIAKFLKVEIEQAHRAFHDAKTTTNVFNHMLSDLFDKSIYKYSQINSLINKNALIKSKKPTHLTILVQNKEGLKNFYKIISDANTTHFNKDALVYKSVLDSFRKSILVGSGCANGDVFKTAYERPYEELKEKIKYYDYLEVQPPECYFWMFENETPKDREFIIQDVIKKIIQAADEASILVCATGDVHHLLSEDSKYRSIYLSVARPNGGGPHPLSKHQALDMHFRTTTEMLECFSFLTSSKAYEIVVENTNKICDMIEDYSLFPKKLEIPRDDFLAKYGVLSMKDAVYDLSFETALNKYGVDGKLPLYVQDRLEKELNGIIGNGYAAVYYISHMLVKNSNDAGYVVGSRGSVGSSFVATMMGITEVNPLKPHYVCPKCHFSAFKLSKADQERFKMPVSDEFMERLEKVGVGFDLEDAACPVCGEILEKNGIDTTFETFLGFNGNKVPDIDLNFSGEYQPKAHIFCQETFGYDNAFRAGTVSTVKDKTAFAYTRDFYEMQNQKIRKTEIERIASFISEAKKTTGQHPGGIVIVPDTIEFTDLIPIQYPPTDDGEEDGKKWRTTHFDYHSFESNLLKLDILGHDDPTVIKLLMDFVHEFPDEFPFDSVDSIPFIDEDVLSLFSSKDVLKINGDDLDRYSSGTLGIPEFGTQFVRGMLETIKPKSYEDIIKVSGLSHGTDVWQKNAEDLFLGSLSEYPKVSFRELIGCRDDIMTYLMEKNLPAIDAFTIMEGVRKGKGLSKEQEELMRSFDVPDWYIYSCNKIKYMFPKAHASAYVIMALRIGWFKVHRPIYYYAAFFSIRAKEFDAEVFAGGRNAIKNKITELEQRIIKKEKLSNKEIDLLSTLYIALEMVLRGYSFKQIHLEKSEATKFVISEDRKSLYLPFITVEALGMTVAESIVKARNAHEFTSLADFERRTSVNKKQYARLKTLGVFDDLPENDTLL